MRRALVTGATGFLGRHVSMRLQRLGWQVDGMGRNAQIGASLQAAGVRFIQADLRDRAAVMAACRGQDVVFHCGALSAPWGRYSDFVAINVDGTRHLCEGCLAQGETRLVHISTPSLMFEARGDRLGAREDDPLPTAAVNAYAQTKWSAEQEVQHAFADGLSGVILRPRAIFGPMDQTLLPRLLAANASRRGIPLIRGGEVLIDLTYVDNVVDAMLLAAECPPDALGAVYNITNDEPVRLIDVLSRLFELLALRLHTRAISYRVADGAATALESVYRLLPFLGEPPITRYAVGVLAWSRTLDVSLARRQLAYAPRISVDEGLQHFARWWQAQNVIRERG